MTITTETMTEATPYQIVGRLSGDLYLRCPKCQALEYQSPQPFIAEEISDIVTPLGYRLAQYVCYRCATEERKVQ